MGETEHLVNDKIKKFCIFLEFIFVDFKQKLYMSKITSKLHQF